MIRLAACPVALLAFAVSAGAQTANTLPIFVSGQVTDAFRDLGCVRITSRASTFSSATAAANVARINAWMSRRAASGRDAILYVSGGYIAINDTLGRPMGENRTIPGYNGGKPFHALPHGLEIRCGGGWANGRFGATYRTNDRTAGFVWVGDTDKPMIRLCGHGNRIRANLYGYPYIQGADVPKKPRCRAAIELVQPPNWTPCGHHDLAVTATGFDKAINIPAATRTTHCDHLLFERLLTRDCLTTFYADNDQAVNHKFNLVEHYCPRGVQSTVFDYQQGGDMKADMVTVTGNYGATVLRLGSPNENLSSYLIDGLSVDRALLKSTQRGEGYFRLFELKSNRGPCLVRIRGHMDWGGADVSRPDWQNGGGEPTVLITPSSTSTRDVALDVFGLDLETAAKYPR